MGKPKPQTVTSIDDLKADPRNPRRIGTDELAGLGKSIDEFGDLSGIVWNRRTGQLVAGHQRIEALKTLYGAALTIKDDHVVTPVGERFKIRVVDWSKPMQTAANIAANSPTIQGTFTSDLEEMIAELQATDMADMIAELRIDTISAPPPDGGPPKLNDIEYQKDSAAKGSISITFLESDRESVLAKVKEIAREHDGCNYYV